MGASLPSILVVAALVVLLGCSDGADEPASGAAEPGSSTQPSPQPSTSRPVVATTGGASAPAPTAAPRATVPEVGVPGLDSTDALCRAWSRFGGSFQVVAVAAAFGEGGPGAAAELEVAAAPTVTAAYDALVSAWPAELAAERDVVADDYLGPFANRARRALDALVAAGATDEDLATLGATWEAALEARDPASPVFEVALDPRLDALVSAAAEELTGDMPAVPDDPDLVVTASTPLTDAYLESTCPDQGTLAGEPTG